jgi:hypothetical protein
MPVAELDRLRLAGEIGMDEYDALLWAQGIGGDSPEHDELEVQRKPPAAARRRRVSPEPKLTGHPLDEGGDV